jgi:hypothetical protein
VLLYTRKGFLVNVYNRDLAYYLLRTVLDDSNNILAKIDIFLAIRDITKADTSYVNFNKAVKKQITVVKESNKNSNKNSNKDIDY